MASNKEAYGTCPSGESSISAAVKLPSPVQSTAEQQYGNDRTLAAVRLLSVSGAKSQAFLTCKQVVGLTEAAGGFP